MYINQVIFYMQAKYLYTNTFPRYMTYTSLFINTVKCIPNSMPGSSCTWRRLVILPLYKVKLYFILFCSITLSNCFMSDFAHSLFMGISFIYSQFHYF